MIGNAWELVESIFEPDKLMLRSGPFYYDENTNALVNREPITPDQRLPFVGFRVCVGAAGLPEVSRNRGGVSRLPAD